MDLPWFIYVILVVAVLAFATRLVARARSLVRHVQRARGSYRKSNSPVTSHDELLCL